MANVIKLSKGLDLNLKGKASQQVINVKAAGKFALVPDDELDSYSFNEQLVVKNQENGKENIFYRLASGTRKSNAYGRIKNMNLKLTKDAYELDSVLLEKGPGSLHANVDAMKSQLKALGTGPKGKPKKLSGETKDKYDALKNMMDKTNALFTNEDFTKRYIKNSLNKVGGTTGADIYEFDGIAYEESKNKEVTFKDATIGKDSRYQAINEAFMATDEYLMMNTEVGMKYQDLQLDISMAENKADKKKALEAFEEFKATDECKQYMTAVENKKKLGEALDKMVAIHKNTAELTEAGKECGAIKVSDTYTDSELEKQAKAKVEAINKAQADKMEEMTKKAQNSKKGMGI